MSTKFNSFLSTLGGFQQPPTGPLTPQQQMQQRGARNRGLSEVLYTLSDVIGDIRGQDIDFQQRSLGRQRLREQQERLREQQEEEQRRKSALRNFIGNNPSMQLMFDAFGSNAVLNFVQEEQKQAQEKQFLNSLGLDPVAQSYVTGGKMNPIEAAEKRSNELKKAEISDISDIEKEAEESISKEEQEKLSKFNEAFGLGDVVEQGFNIGLGALGYTPFKDTEMAINKRTNTNERLRALYIKDYPGRPSVFTQERITEILPTSSLQSPLSAANAYNDIKDDLIRAADELEKNIESGIFSLEDTANLKAELKDTYVMIKQLELATNSLKKDKPVTLKPSTFTNTMPFTVGASQVLLDQAKDIFD
jgi:hypothetical protein